MRNFTFLYIFLFLLTLLTQNNAKACNQNNNVDTIVPNNLYVLNSDSISTITGAHHEHVGIYIIKGRTDKSGNNTVWIFGTGYGDPKSDLLDYQYDRNVFADASRTALEDAQDADKVIQECLSLSKNNVTINYIVPHGHTDHFNQEFPLALKKNLSYKLGKVFVHEADYELVTCGDAYCGYPGLRAFQAAPYPISTPLANKVVSLSGGSCDANIAKIKTDGLGDINIRLDASHTAGTVLLRFDDINTMIYGAKPRFSNCTTPSGYIAYSAHP